MKVILASKNQHKLTELSAILSGLGFEIALESEYGLDIDVDETGTTCLDPNVFLRIRDNKSNPAYTEKTRGGIMRMSGEGMLFWSMHWTVRRASIPPATATKTPMPSASAICLQT